MYGALWYAIYTVESRSQAGMEPPFKWYSLNHLILLTKELNPERQTATQAEFTAGLDTQENQMRYPDTPATGTVHIKWQVTLTKRSHSACPPSNIPGKRSPLPKRQRRMTTGMEGKTGAYVTSQLMQLLHVQITLTYYIIRNQH